MKNNTLPQLFQRGSFKDVHFAMVDLDQQPEIAQALIGDRGVPQLVLFQKSNNEWVRRYISGMQTVEGVEAFIGKGTAVQIATGGELGLPKK
jgi:thioredoxin-like negative regulator of GroEL